MIFMEDNAIKIGGVLLPGIIKSIEIEDNVLVEEADVEGSTSKVKQAKGYEDAKIQVEIILDDSENQSKENKLKQIQKLFKTSGQTQPKVYNMVNEHTSVRKIDRVIFKKMTSKEDNKKQYMTVNLEFWSYIPMKISATKLKTEVSTSSNASYLSDDYKEYLESRGTSSLNAKKNVLADTVDTKPYANRLLSFRI